MLLRNVALKIIFERRRGLIWWAIGIIVLVGVEIVFYPTIRDNGAELVKAMEKMPKEMMALFSSGDVDSIVTPAGYLQSQLFTLMLPMLAMIYTIGLGARSIAGEEEARTLDMLLANPIPRRRVVLQSFGALALLALGLGLVMLIAVLLVAAGVGMDIGADKVAAACLTLVMVALVFGSLALALGAATGKRALSIGVTAALAIGTYLVQQLAPQVEALQPLQKLSPFYYANSGNPLRNGVNWLDMGVLAAIIAVLVGSAVVTFERRDVAV